MANLNRRGFLGALASAPVAVRGFADKAAVLARSGVGVVGGGLSGATEVAMPSWYGNGPSGVNLSARSIASWALEDMRSDARRVHQLDADIASLRSVSACGAIAIQRQRQINHVASESWWDALFRRERISKARDEWYRDNP